MKADFASALARVGDPEDMIDLTNLIRADIERVRKGRAARVRGERSELVNGSMTSYVNWNIKALTFLDADAAETVLLEILNEPEYENEAAFALVRLAKKGSTEKFIYFKQIDYKLVWEARDGRRPSEFDEERRRRYTLAIKQRINTLLDERARNAQTEAYNGRLKSLSIPLASLDSRDSAELVLHIMALPNKWDGWRRISALNSLLFNGVQLPTEKTLNVLNPTIEDMLAQGLYNDQNVWLLKGCLCLLPFVDEPSIGIGRIRQVISEKKFPIYGLRDIVAAVGGSRCDEALTFLCEIAGSVGDRLKQISEEWIKAVVALGSPESKQLLLSFIAPEADEFPGDLDRHEDDLLASYIAEIALTEDKIMKYILQLCDERLSHTKRLLLSKVIFRLGTLEAVVAGLKLIDDNGNPSVPHELWQAIEATFLERRPYGKTENTYTLVPQGSNEIKVKLFDLILKDECRKKSAFALLGQIEVWRLEYGRPNNEPRHPVFDSGEMWPPIRSQA
ncbi:MAG: hypothetical protein Q8K00_18070 [Syntrophales bacterium]|nr:hypothetical protein [Syntrophales bacterium]